jgi:hypothetical protein
MTGNASSTELLFHHSEKVVRMLNLTVFPRNSNPALLSILIEDYPSPCHFSL